MALQRQHPDMAAPPAANAAPVPLRSGNRSRPRLRRSLRKGRTRLKKVPHQQKRAETVFLRALLAS
ncbi:MAG: hypothetical protein U0694_07360 [Anaerolineae bacterium]